MKKILILFLISYQLISAQQTPGTSSPKSYVGNINEMFASAPTSNNLMKFEEVPVSYYTGIPNINLPVINLPTRNRNVNINVELKYHPLNSVPDSRASETGLGWSLVAGGTISRTVRGGGPDEKDNTIPFSSPPKSKFGIYNKFYNPTYKILNDDPSFNQNEYSFDAGLGKFDTEYDLYQYNFLDKSGRFYIVKNIDNSYTVEKLDKNNLKIVCHLNTSSQVIDSFTITDDKGIQFVFEAKETLMRSTSTVKIGLISGSGDVTSGVEIGNYHSAFHLVTIKDVNDSVLAEFIYNLNSLVTYPETPTTTRRLATNVYYYNSPIAGGQSPDGSMPGAVEVQNTFVSAQTKLLTSIDVKGKGFIYFNYTLGREDSNYSNSNNLYKLSSIETKLAANASGYVEKFLLDYNYSMISIQNALGQQQTLKRLLLKKLVKSIVNGQNQEHSIEYNTSQDILTKDPWGFFTGTNNGPVNSSINTDVVKSITYPTKGKVVFNFDENEYSYTPEQSPVTGHWVTHDLSGAVDFSQFNPNLKKEFFTLPSAQTVKFEFNLGNLVHLYWNFKLFKKNADGSFSQVIIDLTYPDQICNKIQPPYCPNNNPNPDGTVQYTLERYDYLEPGTYYASMNGNYSFSNPAPLNAFFTVNYKDIVFQPVKKYRGGGLRIKNISYFDDVQSSVFSKKYDYDYTNIEDVERTSGALIFPKPLYNLEQSYSFQNLVNNSTITYSADFKVSTDYNIYPVQKTQGSDVGYKYVTVRQKDNQGLAKGKTVYKYRSPIDYPLTGGGPTATLPSYPVPNDDYLRGQLVSEKKYDSADRILSESTNEYNIQQYEKITGLKLIDNFTYHMIAEIFSFLSFQQMYTQTGMAYTLTTPSMNRETFGLLLPVQNTEKTYYYDNGVQKMLTNITSTIYNVNDNPTKIIKSFANGEQAETNNLYALEKADSRLLNVNIISTPLEVETKKNNKVISKVETKFQNSANLFPSSIISYDFQNVPNTEVTYDIYDGNGNLLQYTTKDGTPTAIIWGYNNTQPVAKIVGATYADVNALISSIITASNTDALNPSTEDQFIAALDTFRKDPSLSAFQITTYTYDPLIGVTSITPPSGVREVYIYDSANRLMEIREESKTGKLLKEFKYNYKN